jgi:hypothetical protein
VAQDINKQIERRIQAFAEELNQLVRQAALAAVNDALGGRPVSRAAAAAPGRPAKATRGRRSAGGRRSSQQMGNMMEAIKEHVAANPGARMEHISKALGKSTVELRLPVNKLLADGVIRKQGEKRATEYFPGGGGGGGGRRKTAAKRKTSKKRARKKTTRRKKR